MLKSIYSDATISEYCDSNLYKLSLNYITNFKMEIIFILLIIMVSIVLVLINNLVLRKNQYEADRFAGEKYYSIYLVTAFFLKKVNNLSNLTSHSFYVFMYYSHPTALQKIKAISNSIKKY